jgi:hypothetical protein
MIICAECNCGTERCSAVKGSSCEYCAKQICCCSGIHRNENPKSLRTFLYFIKYFLPAALGIEILCITAAVLGENFALYFFGFNFQGIVLGYVMGYAAAGFATFVTILGRYGRRNATIDTCCSVLEQQSSNGFIHNLIITLRNFVLGLSNLVRLHQQPELRRILKTSLFILFTAESACILTAETVDLIFYNFSLLLSIPLALLVGSFTVIAPEAYKRTKRIQNRPK